MEKFIKEVETIERAQELITGLEKMIEAATNDTYGLFDDVTEINAVHAAWITELEERIEELTIKEEKDYGVFTSQDAVDAFMQDWVKESKKTREEIELKGPYYFQERLNKEKGVR